MRNKVHVETGKKKAVVQIMEQPPSPRTFFGNFFGNYSFSFLVFSSRVRPSSLA